MVLHAGGNVLAAFDLFARGRSEWQASTTPQLLISDTGADASFWISIAAAIFAGAAAVWAYTALADVVRKIPCTCRLDPLVESLRRPVELAKNVPCAAAPVARSLSARPFGSRELYRDRAE